MIGEWTKNRCLLSEDPKTITTVNHLSRQPLFCSQVRLAFGFPGERYAPPDADAPPKPLPATAQEFLREFVAQRLLRVWRKVEDFYREDGYDAVVDLAEPAAIDVWAGVVCFGEAMVAGQWVQVETNVDGHPALRFPNFRKWNKLRGKRSAGCAHPQAQPGAPTSAACAPGAANGAAQRTRTASERAADSKARKKERERAEAIMAAKAELLAQAQLAASVQTAQPSAPDAQAAQRTQAQAARSQAQADAQPALLDKKREEEKEDNTKSAATAANPPSPEPTETPVKGKKASPPPSKPKWTPEEKAAHDAQWDTVVELCGLPTPLNSNDRERVGKCIKDIKTVPPYTPEEMRQLPEACAKAGLPSFTLTPAAIAKHMSLTRGQPTRTLPGKETRNGSQGTGRPLNPSRVVATGSQPARNVRRLDGTAPSAALASSDERDGLVPVGASVGGSAVEGYEEPL